MRKIVRHKRTNINFNKKMEECSKVIGDHTRAEDIRYKKYMCFDCINFNGECTKKRIARVCAKKGLKNK